MTTIFQDKLGFLWLGTPGGLYRYDGYQFKWIRNNPKDSLSLGSNDVWNIVEDKEGFIWVGTTNGLNRLDPTKETFTRYNADIANPEGLTNGEIIDLLVDTTGTVWVATPNGLNRYFPETKKFKRYLFSPGTIRPSRTPIQTRDGTIWLGGRDSLYRFHPDQDYFSAIRLPGNDTEANAIRLIYEDQDGMLWIGTQMNGAYQFAPEEGTFLEHFNNDPTNENSLSNNKVSAFIQNGNELWIGTTGGGLNILNLKNKNITRFTGSPPDPSGVNSETIRDAWEDKWGNIWLGSFYDGLYQFKSGQKIFSNFDQKSGLTSKKVIDIEETSNGRIWIAMSTGGLAVFDLEENKITDHFSNEAGNANGLPSGDLKKLFIDEVGILWVAALSGGISYLDKKSGVFKKKLPQRTTDLPYVDPLNDFLVEDNGDIWIAKQDGLVKYINATQSFKTYSMPIDNKVNFKHGANTFITSIYRDQKEQLWFTSYGGINLYDRHKDTLIFFPLPHKVLKLFEDRTGRFLIPKGVVGGIDIFDPKKGVVSKLDFEEPFIIHLSDNSGRIWAFNTEGVFRYDPSNQRIISVNQEDGLGGNVYWTSHLAKSGQLLLGGTDGLAVFHPDSIKDIHPSPRVVLTDFQIFNKSVPIRASIGDTLEWESPLVNSITYTNDITLNHWQNYFSIEFAALDLTSPATHKYQYQLEGYDENWVSTTADRR
ncbi:MAG: two-component regulator propeller domain-containing protein, partial [Bacteroidota bacterium]